MKRGLLLLIIIILGVNLFANPVNETTAKQLAQNFWKTNNIIGVKGDKIFKKRMDDARFVNVAQQCGYSEFFIFNNENGKGFVIIAADDCVTPILAYSYDNNFVADNLPPNLKDWLDGYAEQIRMAVDMKMPATDEISTDWKCLREQKNLPIKSETQVYPLITTTWGQSPYYNALCPYDYTHNERTVTGCVATAMAQIMKYWSYPEHGFGSHSYIPQNHPEYGTQFADFSSTTYQWSAMPNNVTSSNTAVATLMYHCGVAVEMNYGTDVSYAQIASQDGYFEYCAENAFKTYFGYKNTLYGVPKQDDAQWISLLKNELDNARPILYAGAGQTATGYSGHAFICDGYNNSDYFHFNWGWSGQGQGNNNNAYYYINNLNPLNHNYSLMQHAVVGIEPNNTTYNFNLTYYSTPEMSNDEYWFYDDISVYAEVLNNGTGAFNGYLGAGVYYELNPGSNEYYLLNIMDEIDCTSQPLPGGYYSYHNYSCAGGPPYIPGSYLVAMLYSMDGNTWNLIDSGNYNYGYFDIVYNSSSINVNSNYSILTGDGSCLYQNTDATINVDIINNGSTTFYGQFRITLMSANGSMMQTIDIFDCTNGLPSNYHYTNGIDFTGLITVDPGTYLMSLDYKASGSTSWHYAGAADYQNPVWVYVAPEPVYADPYEPNNSQNLAHLFTPNFSGNSATVNTTGSNLHNSSDIDYYKINLNSGYNYTITPRLHDAYNSGNGNTYSVDAMFAYSTDGVNWSEFYDDVMSGNISIENGGAIYFCVIPYYDGSIGTYLLSTSVTRTPITNNYIVSVSANPSNGGTVSGGGTYSQGTSCTVHASANSGFVFTNWTENGSQVSTNANYTFTVNGNRNLVANFSQSTYTIQASAGANGIITPSGTINVAQGANQSFSMIPNTGYEVQNVYIDGNSVGALTSYTFANVTANHQIYVTFMHVDSVEENDDLALEIYPNPTNGEFTVEYEDLQHICIVNPLGQIVYNAEVESNQVHIDLSGMVKGVYIIQIDANGFPITRKIIVE